VAFREFVVKIASRCNLACDYCYVYAGPDQSWRAQPRVMAPRVMDALARRIGEHAAVHELDRVRISLHGGEPLLAGLPAIDHLVGAIRGALPAGTRADVTVQTNGTLLDEPYLRLFARHRVRVGVSLDGDSSANDQHRLYPNGRSSVADVTRALAMLRAHPGLFAGILCVIDLANDPVATYRVLCAHQPPVLDFLLPNANWSVPPPRPATAGPAPYAAWLTRVFDEWYDGERPRPSVRLFDETIRLMLSGGSHAGAGSEAVGGAPVAFAVVTTDGGIEPADFVKTGHREPRVMSVLTSSFDEALAHPAFASQLAGRDGLCETCRTCPLVGVCGGGQHTHRYRAGHGYLNPSVYCPDLVRLIGHIADRVEADLVRAS
jgi:uncharacterized protein